MPDIAHLISLIKQYLDPHTIAAAGHTVLTLVIFAETGLAAGFFFPGDSLMVVAGLLAAKGTLSLPIMLVSLSIAGILGDAVGYFTGLKLGPLLFTRPKSLLFRPAHLRKAHEFYKIHGSKTIIMARFVPFVRTFAPIVAGAGQMPYAKFVVYNIVGGISWVFSMLLTGYFLGQFPIVEKHVEKVVILVVVLSLMPIVVEYLKSRRTPAKS
jgi:membrane-associated protein